MPIRNVIFDLGGVVLEWSSDKVLERCYADQATRQIMRETLFRHPDWQAFDRGDVSEIEFLDRVHARTGCPTAEIARLLDVVRDILVEKPDTVALLQALHRSGVPLYCLSNMPVSVFEHVRQRHAFWHVFQGIVVSGAVRMAKPERAIFEHLLSRHQINAAETIFIDDHAPNIEGARAAGLETILFQDAAQCSSELRAHLQWQSA